MRIMPPACLAILASLGSVHAADLDHVYAGQPRPPVVYDPLPPDYFRRAPPVEARVEIEAEARARYYHSPYPNPYADLFPSPAEPYAPSFFGNPLSPPNYGYGY